MNESMDRVLADWLREGPEMGPREGLERTLAATRRIGQRPGWTFVERWLPMQLTLTRTPSLRPLLLIVVIALLTIALIAAALLVGSPKPLAPPFGPARNGAIVFLEGGDLFIADQLNGTRRALVAGPEADSFPFFSNQGHRLAFVRGSGDGFDVMTVNPDGSGLAVLSSFPGDLVGAGWSPDGNAILVNYTDAGIAGFRLAVVQADGSGSRDLDLGFAADYGSWRPDGRHIVFRGPLENGIAGLFIADGDGTNVRQVPIEAFGLVDFENLGWSPDGKHLSFMTSGRVAGTSLGWQIGIADIDPSGTMTAIHHPRLDPASTREMGPVWSPDSSQLSALIERGSRRQIGIFNADGSGYRAVGPETSIANILGSAWSPDGRTLLITQFPDNESRREAERKMWSVDVASGVQTEVQTPVATWQRLAP